MTTIRKIALAFAVTALCALGSTACSQEDEAGRWVELPGGRMVQLHDEVDYDDNRLIYKIDAHRYLTMMTHDGDCSGLGGTVRYHDTKRGIASEVGDMSLRTLPIFAMDPQQYLAMPVPSGDLVNNARLYFSTDYGRSWEDIRFISLRAGLVVKKDVLVYLQGSAYNDEPVEIDGAKVWSFSRLVREKEQPGETTPGGDYYDHRENTWTLRFGASKDDAPDVKIDIDAFTKVAPPSGWRHLRCEPMPTTPTQP